MKKILVLFVMFLVGCMQGVSIPPVSHERTTSIRSIIAPEISNSALVPIPGVSLTERYLGEIKVQAPACDYSDTFVASDVYSNNGAWSVSLSGQDFYWMSNRAKNLGCQPANIIVNYTISIPNWELGYNTPTEISVTVLEHIVP